MSRNIYDVLDIRGNMLETVIGPPTLARPG
jgi:hypothetical protein